MFEELFKDNRCEKPTDSDYPDEESDVRSRTGYFNTAREKFLTLIQICLCVVGQPSICEQTLVVRFFDDIKLFLSQQPFHQMRGVTPQLREGIGGGKALVPLSIKTFLHIEHFEEEEKNKMINKKRKEEGEEKNRKKKKQKTNKFTWQARRAMLVIEVNGGRTIRCYLK
ncbi:hypothetical protein PoB_004724200 [Plakobranchus ocellatus]|uniref:Uncharacterized protein n=1 Tax=Plakobranchus ocellatus TaxID=259542 RepID=A0AAV4BN05_9GAST|nr:hypothetical protein PoB_004724200 [Plakobranchus ocellatus]